MKHMVAGTNLALGCLRQSRRGEEGAFFVAEGLIHKNFVSLYDVTTVFPLYIYPNREAEKQTKLKTHEDSRRPNLSAEFVKQFAESVGLQFIPDGRGDLKKNFGPEDLFHFIYAIFQSPSYRKRYAEFLNIDFPRVPVLDQQDLFVKLCRIGSKLVAFHTMRQNGDWDVLFDVPGSNLIEQIAYAPPNKEAGIRGGRVYINAEQYFEGISPAVWQMRIGGYQVCEKWLKDRKGRTLTYEDIEHYQRTVSALAETRSLMAQIDALIADHGGWPLA
jgi:hypothetical protein